MNAQYRVLAAHRPHETERSENGYGVFLCPVGLNRVMQVLPHRLSGVPGASEEYGSGDGECGYGYDRDGEQ